MSENENQIAPVKQPRALVRKKRDQATRRGVARLKSLCPWLDNPAYNGTLRAYVQANYLLERGYAFLREQDILNPDSKEIRQSYESVRRMADSVARLAAMLSLTPATLKQMSREKVLNPLEGD